VISNATTQGVAYMKNDTVVHKKWYHVVGTYNRTKSNYNVYCYITTVLTLQNKFLLKSL
jgi:hypothetical protein